MDPKAKILLGAAAVILWFGGAVLGYAYHANQSTPSENLSVPTVVESGDVVFTSLDRLSLTIGDPIPEVISSVLKPMGDGAYTYDEFGETGAIIFAKKRFGQNAAANPEATGVAPLENPEVVTGVVVYDWAKRSVYVPATSRVTKRGEMGGPYEGLFGPGNYEAQKGILTYVVTNCETNPNPILATVVTFDAPAFRGQIANTVKDRFLRATAC